MKIRRILSLVLIISLISTLGNVTFSATSNERTRDDKASILNQLNILAGNGVDYNLEGQLTRSEAVTFIVGFLNAKDTVERNKDYYSKTSFKDVPSNEWYAPYVGYCVEKGIINGYDVETFGPNDPLTEKAFLTMVLTALGHKANVAFQWGTVFTYSYTVGLVTDFSYIGRQDDTTNYKRGDVVELLYHALTMEHIDTEEYIYERFISSGVISNNQAMDFGLVGDNLPTNISKINVLSETEIELVFNENISEINQDAISIVYEDDMISRELYIQEIYPQEELNKFILTFAEKDMRSLEYTIRIAEIIDEEGHTTQNIEDTFQGYKKPQIQSDYFRISSIEPVNSQQINVYFTHPVSNNITGNYYTLYKNGAEVKEISSRNIIANPLTTVDNGASIYFDNFSFEDVNAYDYYELKIDGAVTSAYGTRLNEGQGDVFEFQPVTTVNEFFDVKEIQVLNPYTIQMVFNKAVNSTVAKQIFSYYITDRNGTPMKIAAAQVLEMKGYDGKVVVIRTENALLNNQEHTIMINYLTDVTRQFTIQEKEYKFIGDTTKYNYIELLTSRSLDDYTIELEVSEPLDKKSAEDVSNYLITGITTRNYVTQPKAAYYNEKDPYKVKLFLPDNRPLVAYQWYQIEIKKGLVDYIGNDQIETEFKVSQVFHGEHKNSKAIIEEAMIVGQDTIRLTFSKEIGLTLPNVLNTNYTLYFRDNGMENRKEPIGVSYINPTTLILRFDNLKEGLNYRINFNEIVDYSGQVTKDMDYVEVIQGVK
jgi:hypothetical protein